MAYKLRHTAFSRGRQAVQIPPLRAITDNAQIPRRIFDGYPRKDLDQLIGPLLHAIQPADGQRGVKS